MSTIAATNSLFEIDVELDSLLDEIEEQTAQGGEPSGELVARFQKFCSACSAISSRRLSSSASISKSEFVAAIVDMVLFLIGVVVCQQHQAAIRS